nr:endochitinase 2 [Quercus suber]
MVHPSLAEGSGTPGALRHDPTSWIVRKSCDVHKLCLAKGVEQADFPQGQEDDGKERSLGDYCASDEGADIVIISFISSFGNGVYPNGYLGDCAVNSDGSFEGCDQTATDIATCHANGKKVFLSIGGAGANWQLNDSGDAQGVAYSLWNSYANPSVTDTTSPRPFGSNFVDGWDIDIEDNGNNGNSDQYLKDLVNTLRGYFSSDSANTYSISGAPQCPLNPIADMEDVIMNSQFDYLLIQFYNNNCAAAELVKQGQSNPDGDGTYNLADWPAYISGGASANAKLLVGIPSSTVGADDPYFFVDIPDLPTLIGDSTGVANFGGVMLYDAGDSDTPNANGCNYVQQVRRVLDTGANC